MINIEIYLMENKNKIQEMIIKLMSITKLLADCANKNCSSLRSKTINDGILLANNLLNLKPNETKSDILKKHFQKENVKQYQYCIFESCKKTYIELLQAFLTIFENTQKDKLFQKEIKELKKFVKKSPEKISNDNLEKANSTYILLAYSMRDR